MFDIVKQKRKLKEVEENTKAKKIKRQQSF